LAFSWPKLKNTPSIKREIGEDRLKDADLSENLYYKRFYVDPAQATHYEIRTEKPIDTRKVMAFSEPDLRKRDKFRLTVHASSTNTNLFEQIDSITDYYTLTLLNKIQDSLYNNRKDRNMKPYEFIWEAERIQDLSDDVRYQTIRQILWNNLSNRVVPCIMLEAQDIDKNAKEYIRLFSALPEEIKSDSCALQLKMKLQLIGRQRL